MMPFYHSTAILLIALVSGGCSIKKIAVNKLGNALASSGTTFEGDDDPDLVGESLPFALKLMESLLAESPRHTGLLLATASGFTEYSYAFVGQRAERAPHVFQLRGFGAAAFAGGQVRVELGARILQRAPPIVHELGSGLFAIHDALSPDNSK